MDIYIDEKERLGKAYLPDYAYSKIRSQLKKEFKIWKESR